MSFLGRLLELGARLDRAVSEKTGVGRALSRLKERIPPPARRWGVRIAPPLAIVVVVAVFAAALSSIQETTKEVGTGDDKEALSGIEPGDPQAEGILGSEQPATGSSANSGSSGKASGSAQGTGGSTASLGGKVGPGVTSSEIVVGFAYAEGAAEYRSQIGLKGTEGVDNRSVFQALVDHVNRLGGVAGRKLSPLYFTWREGSGSDAAIVQAACSYFTEDHKVFFAFDNMQIGMEDHLAACLSQRNTALIASTTGDERAFRDLAPYIYAPIYINVTRKARIYVEGLAEQGFFEPGAKIGLLRFDFPAYKRATEEVIKPELAARGLKLAEDVEVSPRQSVRDGGAYSRISSAVLRMRESGVTHMLLLDANANLALFFMPAAESQGYRPRYGLTSDSYPFIMASNVPREQFRDAVGVGWNFYIDVGSDRAPKTPGRSNCVEVMARAGVKYTDSSSEFLATRYCDQVLFFAKAAGDAQTLNAAGFMSAVERLATGFESASTFSTGFGPGRYDGVAAISNFFFDDACNCFRYRGESRRIP